MSKLIVVKVGNENYTPTAENLIIVKQFVLANCITSITTLDYDDDTDQFEIFWKNILVDQKVVNDDIKKVAAKGYVNVNDNILCIDYRCDIKLKNENS